MTTIIEAIYADGQFKPIKALDLPNQQRVRLVVETIDGASSAKREAAFERIKARIARSKFSYGGLLPSRDELHDRRL